LFDDCQSINVIGKGEASIIENLSPDWNNDYENQLAEICRNVNEHVATNFSKIHEFPSIRFALESALLDLKNGGKEIYFPSEFAAGKKIHLNQRLDLDGQ
jgi:hypothetical protein